MFYFCCLCFGGPASDQGGPINFAQTNILENRAGIASPIPPLDPRMEKKTTKKERKIMIALINLDLGYI